MNRPGLVRVGSVGQPLAGTTVRVSDDGELLVRGRQVMRGYWENAQASDEVLSPEGWLHTGDLGAIDDEGFVWITGRKKELLVTAGGKNVRRHRWRSGSAPIPWSASAWCWETADRSQRAGHSGRCGCAQWAQEHGKPNELAVLADDPDLRREIQAAVDEANQVVSQAEYVRKFAVLTHDWTEESGAMSPSLKVRRDRVFRHSADVIDRMYSGRTD